jgi:hypothetical protein
MAIPIRRSLKRLGEASPMVPAVLYTVATLIAEASGRLVPKTRVPAVLALLLWLAALIMLWVVVTWYRDDDWLAAGFLVGLTILLGAMIARVLVSTVVDRSPAQALFQAPGAMLGVMIRGVITVPVCGGLIALARWLTGRYGATADRPRS